MTGAQSIATSNSQHSLAVSNMLFYRFSTTPHSNDCSINLDFGDRLKSPTSGGLLETQASIQCFADPNTTTFNDHNFCIVCHFKGTCIQFVTISHSKRCFQPKKAWLESGKLVTSITTTPCFSPNSPTVFGVQPAPRGGRKCLNRR